MAYYLQGAVVVLVLSATVLTALEPAPDSLRYVIAVFRHGIRTPLANTIPNDPNKEKYLELANGEMASLSRIGKEQMFAVGKGLRERYGSFISQYQESKVNVTSTPYSRTIMSALSVMAGMFPPSHNIFEGLPWQPVTVWNSPQYIEKGYIMIDRKPSDCPIYSKMSAEAMKKLNSPDTRKEYQPIYRIVQQYTGEPNIETPKQLYDIFDTLYFAKRNGFTLPSWSTEPRSDFNNRPLFPDLLMPFAVEFFEANMYYGGNEEMLNIFSGPLLGTINSKFLKISANPSAPERFWYHSTHDTTIYPLLRGLKVDDPLTSEPGDGVLLELHVENEEKYVKIYMYHSINNSIKELKSKLCPDPCTLAKFSVNLKGLTPEQWKIFCNKKILYGSLYSIFSRFKFRIPWKKHME